MQVYGLKLNYFMRYGERDNSIVFDITPSQQKMLDSGISIDKIYADVSKNLPLHVENIGKNDGCFSNMICVCGALGGDTQRSNGAGKSTIMESICYAFYNKLIRKSANTDKKGVAYDAVVTTFSKGEPPNCKKVFPDGMRESYAEILFSSGTRFYRLKRGYNITKSGNKSPILDLFCYNSSEKEQSHIKNNTDEYLEKVLDMPFDLFLNSQMFGQGDAGKFLFGTDKNRKEIFSVLLNIDEVISKMNRKILDGTNTLGQKEYAIKTELATLHSSLSKNPIDFDISKKSLTEQIVLSKKKMAHLRDELTSVNKESGIAILDATKSKLKQIQDSLKPKYDLYQEKKKNIDKEEKNISDNISLVEKNIKDLKDTLVKKQNTLTRNIKEVESGPKEKELRELLDKVPLALKNSLKSKEKIVKNESEKSFLSSSIAVKESKMKELESEGKILKKQLEQDSASYECGECKQVVTREHISSRFADVKSKYVALKEEYTVESVKLKEINEVIASETVLLQKFQEVCNRESEIKLKISSLAKLKEENNALTSEIEDLNIKNQKYLKNLDELKSLIPGFKSQIKDVEYLWATESETDIEEIKKLKQDIVNFETEYKNISEKKKNLEKEISDLELNISISHTKMGTLEKEREVRVEQEAKVKKLEEELTSINSDIHAHKLLSSVFNLDGIQSKIIDKYIPVFNTYVNETLKILSSGTIGFYASINDGGKIDINITGCTSTAYDMLSGGEKTLIRLAVDIALSLLYFNRTSTLPELINLDEVFGPLDEKYSENAFRLIEILSKRFSRVILITHQENIKNKIPKKIYANKDIGDFGLTKLQVAI